MLYGIIMNLETFDKLKDEGEVKETNGMTFFNGIVVGIHKNVEENKVIKCQTKNEYVKRMIMLDLDGTPKLGEGDNEQPTTENRRSV